MLADAVKTYMTREVYTWWGETFGWAPLDKNVASVYKNSPYEKWKPITWEEVLNERREKQKAHLEWIREKDVVEFKPCFVFTFLNKSNWFFDGWWLYVMTLKRNFPIGFKGQNKQLILPIIKLFPCGFLPLEENFDDWAKEFARIYHRSTRERKKNIGMIAAWAKIDNGDLVEIIRDDKFRRRRINEN